ncbi:MAG: cation transporter [Candidatus Nitrosocosmicus sp.]|jgi:divalent metal cation (Fe/Co/Zn/Cd) transporter|nr:cation transporter [Candidatus Nitrosocosmicus sp. SS]MDR4491728.1 cation transporter [Candidatus Nitrosocosmicus sp.]
MVRGSGGSKKAIYAALFGNLGIAISKLIAALFTGSISMWAETYHSFSDAFNQVLLLVGIRTSKKQVSEKHLLGYGKEQFLWSFIVATLIFGISGVLSLEQGIGSFMGNDFHRLNDLSINYIILAISFVFEANVL